MTRSSHGFLRSLGIHLSMRKTSASPATRRLISSINCLDMTMRNASPQRKRWPMLTLHLLEMLPRKAVRTTLPLIL
ncbi:hypothetical protein Egran_03085, partial [Elaphomyces granulatus]